MTLIERLRWRIANLLNRRPGQCWAALVTWSLSTEWRTRGWWSPSQPIDWACRSDAARNGHCLCGKFRGGAS